MRQERRKGAWLNASGHAQTRAAILCGSVMQVDSRHHFTREAEGVRFELTRPFGLPVFKTGAINRSATPPGAIRVAGSVPLLVT